MLPSRAKQKIPGVEGPLAQALADLSTIPATTARNRAFLIIHASQAMVLLAIRQQGSLHLLSQKEREDLTIRLGKNLREFSWSKLGLNEHITAQALSQEIAELVARRITNGESLRFLEELLYERFTALEGPGAETALSALQLPNYRRRRPPESLHTTRRLSPVS